MNPDTRLEKLKRACEIIKSQDDRETEIATLVATAMATGYQACKLELLAKPA